MLVCASWPDSPSAARGAEASQPDAALSRFMKRNRFHIVPERTSQRCSIGITVPSHWFAFYLLGFWTPRARRCAAKRDLNCENVLNYWCLRPLCAFWRSSVNEKAALSLMLNRVKAAVPPLCLRCTTRQRFPTHRPQHTAALVALSLCKHPPNDCRTSVQSVQRSLKSDKLCSNLNTTKLRNALWAPIQQKSSTITTRTVPQTSSVHHTNTLPVLQTRDAK